MKTLQQQLDAAIAREDYELAARLRDRIKKDDAGAFDFPRGGMDVKMPGQFDVFMAKKDWFDKAGEIGEKAGRDLRKLISDDSTSPPFSADRVWDSSAVPWDEGPLALAFRDLVAKFRAAVDHKLKEVITRIDGTEPNSYSVAQYGFRVIDHKDMTEMFLWKGERVLSVSYVGGTLMMMALK